MKQMEEAKSVYLSLYSDHKYEKQILKCLMVILLHNINIPSSK